MANMKQVKALLSKHHIPLVIDACRFGENSYFIKEYEPGFADWTLLDIAREMFSHADAATMSAKKDGLANIGGFFACNEDRWAEDFRNLLILTEGFPTYGGLAGRDLEAIAVGLKEALEFDYQHYRHATVEYIAIRLIARDIPIVRPAGGHAVFIDAPAFGTHLKPHDYPGIGLVNALYLEGGIRAVELDSVMFGRVPPGAQQEIAASRELVRLAFPRRVYTQSHGCRVAAAPFDPYRIIKQAPFLRHFTAHFARAENTVAADF